MNEDALYVVYEQAEDHGLWFLAATAPEAYLQAALRRLHAAVEAAPAPQEDALPALPPGSGWRTRADGFVEQHYTTYQMHAYARAAVAAYREDAERQQRTIEILAIERDTARAQLDRALATLTGIHLLLQPADVTIDDKTFRFNNPNANETLRALSARIRAIPDEIAAIDSARGKA